MSEPFFFPRPLKTSLADIVACTGAAVADGADLSAVIRGVAPIDEAGLGELTFFDLSQDIALLETSKAAACFIAPLHAPLVPHTTLALVVDEPSLGMARALRLLFPQTTRPHSLFDTAGINPGASIHPEARLEQDVIVDPGAVIGPSVEIGSGSIIGANSVIGADVRIGRSCLISPHVTISHALIGDRVILHPGVRVGQLGILCGKAGVSGTGRVIIQDGVEVGANSTIDRGLLSDTVLGEETKIANLVEIAANATLGRFCTIPSQARVQGGARLADFFSGSPG